MDCRPSALRVSDSTITMRVKLVTIIKRAGATASSVSAMMMVTLSLGLLRAPPRLMLTWPLGVTAVVVPGAPGATGVAGGGGGGRGRPGVGGGPGGGARGGGGGGAAGGGAPAGPPVAWAQPRCRSPSVRAGSAPRGRAAPRSSARLWRRGRRRAPPGEQLDVAWSRKLRVRSGSEALPTNGALPQLLEQGLPWLTGASVAPRRRRPLGLRSGEIDVEGVGIGLG